MGIQAMKVPTIFTAIDKFSGVVGTMTRNMSKFNGTAQASAMRTSTFLNKTGTQMLGAGIGMATGIGYAVNEAVKFEKAMATVNTTIDNTTPEMITKMGDEVLQMSKKIPKPISELTDALYDVVSAGIDARYSMTVLKNSSILAVSGLGTVKEGVDVITSSINAFGLAQTESARVSDLVFKAVKYGKTTVSGLAESFGTNAALVKNSNVSLEEYLATTATLTTSGMSASRAQTQVASAITALIKKSGPMQKIFNSLGVKDVPEWIKQNKGLVNTLAIVSKKGKEMGIDLSKAFGRKEGFSALLSLLGPLNKKYNDVIEDMLYGTNSVNAAFEKQTKTVSSSIQIMKNKMTVLGITIGNELIPRVNGFLETLSPVIDSTIEWAKRNEGLVNLLLSATVALIGFGLAAKVGAGLFWGLSKVIGICASVTKFYNGVMLTAALTGNSVVGVLGKLSMGFLSSLGPIALVVAALSTLLIGYKLYSDATRKTMFTVTDSYRKNDATIKYSTIVMKSEFDKQIKLMQEQKNKINEINNISKPINLSAKMSAKEISKSIYDIPANLSPDNPFMKQLNNVDPNSIFGKQNINYKNMTNWIPNATNNDVVNQNSVKNLAGQSDVKYSLPKIGGELKITVESNDGSKATVDDNNLYGLKAVLSSTKKSSKND